MSGVIQTRANSTVSSFTSVVYLSECGWTANILAESPDQVVWAFAYPLGEVHLLNAMENHGVDLYRV